MTEDYAGDNDMANAPRRSNSLWRDLRDIKPAYLILVLACIGLGAKLRDGGDDIDRSMSTDDQWSTTMHRDTAAANDDWESEQRLNTETIAALANGVSRSTVTERLGPAAFEDHFGTDIDVLYYRTHLDKLDGVTTRDETTALVMRGGVLVGQRELSSTSKTWVAAGKNWIKRQRANRKHIDALTLGMTRTEVLDALGPPDFDDELVDGMEILAWRTRSKTTDGFTSRSETTPLMFVDDKLVL